MRKLVFLALPALALAPLMACEDDSVGGGPSPTFDAGLSDWSAPPTTFDGSTPDATPDAPVVPAVSVTVTSVAGPKADVRVVFHDASGAVLDTKLTGGDGKATHTGATPAMVSALVMSGSRHDIVTWTGVEDGDDLQLRADESGEEVGMYSVALSSMPDGGVGIIDVESPCSDNQTYGTATELPMYRYCTRAQNAVLATARTYSGTVVSHAFKKGNPGVSDGGTGAITLGDFKAPSSFSMTVANLPGESRFDATLLEIADGAGFRNRWDSWEGSTVTYPTATSFAEAYQATASFGIFGTARAITKRIAPAASVEFDYADLLPAIESAVVDASNPRRPVVSWEAAAPTTDADGGLVRFSFSGPEGWDYSWTFVVAPGATSVTAPAMPPDAESFLPPAPDSGVDAMFSPPKILVVEADVLPGYAAFRRQQGVVLGPEAMYLNDGTLPALPVNGTFRTSIWAEVPR